MRKGRKRGRDDACWVEARACRRSAVDGFCFEERGGDKSLEKVDGIGGGRLSLLRR